MMADKAEMITIGKIVNTQGHLGEVRIWPLTDFPERFSNLKQVYINLNGHTEIYHIDGVRFNKRFVLVKFAEVPDMNRAETLKEALIQLPSEDLLPLPEDTYYIFELIGLQVHTGAGEKLGIITDVIQTGSNDVYVVKPPLGKDILIPALKQVVKKIDLSEKKVVVELLPGLLDIYR